MGRDDERGFDGAAFAKIAIVLSLIGVVLFPVALGGVVFGIGALRGGGPKGKSLGALALGLVSLVCWVSVIGGDVLRFKVRAKQAECKTHLAEAYAAERAFMTKTGAYSTSPKAVGFSVTTAPHDLLLFAADGPLASRYDQLGDADVGVPADPWHWEPTNAQLKAQIPAAVLADVGMHGTCPDCWVTLVCAGQIDHDPTIDVWTVSTHDRTVNGKTIRAGEPFNDVDDVWQ